MDPEFIANLVKNLEPEFRVRGRAIDWKRMSYVFDPRLAQNPSSDQIDAAIEAGAYECTPTFETDTYPTLNPAQSVTGIDTGFSVPTPSSIGPSPKPVNPLGTSSTK